VRAISQLILTASSAELETAREVAVGTPVETWSEVVPLGVSANPSDALSRLPGTGPESGNAEMRIDWTWISPQPGISAVTVTPGIAPILEAGSVFLRGTPEEETIQAV